MGICFVTGSQLIEQRPAISVLHSVEYLRYDFAEKRVEVAGDFFVRNNSEQSTPVIGLHPGSVEFTPCPKHWLHDEHWTREPRTMIAEKIGLRLTDGAVSLHEAGQESIAVKPISAPLGPWWPERPREDVSSPFTGWTSASIPPLSVCVFGLRGTVHGVTYADLMPSDGLPISILGGAPLLRWIKQQFPKFGGAAKTHEQELAQFEKEFLSDPGFYHVLFEQKNGRAFEPVYVSSSTWKGYSNRRVGGRTISWYWSDTSLELGAKANGPVLELRVA